MSNNPIDRVRIALSKALAYHRVKKNMTIKMVADAGELFESKIELWENAVTAPDVTELFRLASALGIDPAILFIDIVTEWRRDPTDIGLYKSRASDFAKLYRLGYYVDPGDFREIPRTYGVIEEAVRSARKLNATRHSKRLPLLDTVLTYVRLGGVFLRADEERRP